MKYFSRDESGFEQMRPVNFLNLSNMTKNTDAKVISLTYELRNGHAEGEIIEEVTQDRPAEFLFGAGKLVKQFEDHVMDLQAEETIEFTVP